MVEGIITFYVFLNHFLNNSRYQLFSAHAFCRSSCCISLFGWRRGRYLRAGIHLFLYTGKFISILTGLHMRCWSSWISKCMLAWKKNHEKNEMWLKWKFRSWRSILSKNHQNRSFPRVFLDTSKFGKSRTNMYSKKIVFSDTHER